MKNLLVKVPLDSHILTNIGQPSFVLFLPPKPSPPPTPPPPKESTKEASYAMLLTIRPNKWIIWFKYDSS